MPHRLEPHENSTTDVILLGHSMGGLLGVEVALMPPGGPYSDGHFRHRLLGTISFDTPFLGMHPGLVVSGIGSLFRPAPPPPGSAQATQAGSSTASGISSPDTASLVSPPMTPGSIATESSATDYTSLTPSISSALSTHSTASDPYYNPPFPNDVHLQERTGWNKLLHFVTKHSDGLTTATKQYFVSHIEFGGCLADFSGLKNRYRRVRALEDVDDTTESAFASGTRRIRFVNYYTASTGIPKKPKTPHAQIKENDGTPEPLQDLTNTLSLEEPASPETRSQTPTQGVFLEEHHETGAFSNPEEPSGASVGLKDVQEQIRNLGEASGVQAQDDFESQPMQHIDSMPIQSDEEDSHSEDDDFHDAHEVTPEQGSEATTRTEPAETNTTPTETRTEAPHPPTDPALPPIPPAPEEPIPIDLTLYTDKDERRVAEKEHKRLQKTYQQAVKNRESALKDRRKLLEKREKKAQQEREKARKLEEKQRLKEEREVELEVKQQLNGEEQRLKGEELRLKEEELRLKGEEKRLRGEEQRFKGEEQRLKGDTDAAELSAATTTTSTPSPPSTANEAAPAAAAPGPPPKPKKDRRFCLLPGDLERAGAEDKCWVRVYMEGVDEVGAHCGLFFPGPQYESLVGDAGERVAEWVRADATRRAIGEMRGLD